MTTWDKFTLASRKFHNMSQTRNYCTQIRVKRTTRMSESIHRNIPTDWFLVDVGSRMRHSRGRKPHEHVHRSACDTYRTLWGKFASSLANAIWVKNNYPILVYVSQLILIATSFYYIPFEPGVLFLLVISENIIGGRTEGHNFGRLNAP